MRAAGEEGRTRRRSPLPPPVRSQSEELPQNIEQRRGLVGFERSQAADQARLIDGAELVDDLLAVPAGKASGHARRVRAAWGPLPARPPRCAPSCQHRRQDEDATKMLPAASQSTVDVTDDVFSRIASRKSGPRLSRDAH